MVQLPEWADPSTLPAWAYGLLAVLTVLSRAPFVGSVGELALNAARRAVDVRAAASVDAEDVGRVWHDVYMALTNIAGTGGWARVVLLHAIRAGADGWKVSKYLEVQGIEGGTLAARKWSRRDVGDSYVRNVILRVLQTDDPFILHIDQLDDSSQLKRTYESDGVTGSYVARVMMRPSDDPTSVWYISANLTHGDPLDADVEEAYRAELSVVRESIGVLGALPTPAWAS